MTYNCAECDAVHIPTQSVATYDRDTRRTLFFCNQSCSDLFFLKGMP